MLICYVHIKLFRIHLRWMFEHAHGEMFKVQVFFPHFTDMANKDAQIIRANSLHCASNVLVSGALLKQ